VTPSLDFATLEELRQAHPAWKLLRADLAPLVLSFLHKTYVVPNLRTLPLSELSEKLEDELYRLRATHGEDRFRRRASDYLDEWAGDERGWLRKYYPANQDEPHFDLTPASEKAILWADSLIQRTFIGTESRLLTIFNLLKQIVEGAETDPKIRIAELRRKSQEIKDEIERIQRGQFDQLDDTALRERFYQMSGTARELLGDFREVEENFRRLDRMTRERIALWDSSRGELLDDIFGQRDSITDSDQGRSFRAFWDFLLSSERQEQLTSLLEKALEIPAIASTEPDRAIRRIHYDWLTAGEHAQRTVSALSQQLRRFLDDRAWLENRRIMEVLRSIEGHALNLREQPPAGDVMEIEETHAALSLPMERPLFSPPYRVELSDEVLTLGQADLDTQGLFSQVFVDKGRLLGHVREALASQSQISLGQLLNRNPLKQGLAELVTYLTLRGEDFDTVFDEENTEEIAWEDEEIGRKARLPRLNFVR
jgi:flagellar motility protein MotE (MotC chaperone)